MNNTGLSRFVKVAYGSGNLAANLMNCTISAYISFYYTDVAGLPIAAVGLILLLCRILDGISDLCMGIIVDRTHTKHGKARPWLLWIAIPYGLAIFVLFFSPNWGLVGKIIYAGATYMICTLIYTAISVPYNTLSALITTKSEDRIDLATMRQLFGFIGPLIILSISMPIINALGGTQYAWSILAGIYGIAGIIIFLLVFYSTKEVVTDNNESKKVSSMAGVKYLLKNKYWIMVLALSIVLFLASGLKSGVMVYYCTYILGSSNYYTPLSMAGLIPTIICCFFIPGITAKYGKRNVSFVSLFIAILGNIVMFFGTENITILMIGTVIATIGAAPINIAVFAMLGDAVVYGDWKYGFRNDGLAFSASTFAEKVGNALGGAIATFALAIGGYVANAAIQTSDSIIAMKACLIAIPILFNIMLMVILKFYKLDEKLPQIVKELEERK